MKTDTNPAKLASMDEEVVTLFSLVSVATLLENR
jgi:hypothetical protein